MLMFYDEGNLVPNITYMPTIRAGIGVLRRRQLVIRPLWTDILCRINQSKKLDKSLYHPIQNIRKAKFLDQLDFSLQTNGQEPVLKQLQQGRVEAATLLSRSRKSETTLIHFGKLAKE